MQPSRNNQHLEKLDPLDVWVKMRRHQRWNKQKKIARRLNRSVSAISKALKGKRPTLLGRINRLLDAPDPRKSSRKAA